MVVALRTGPLVSRLESASLLSLPPGVSLISQHQSSNNLVGSTGTVWSNKRTGKEDPHESHPRKILIISTCGDWNSSVDLKVSPQYHRYITGDFYSH